MNIQDIPDFRGKGNIRKTFKEIEKIARSERSLEGKISIWKNFLISNKKNFSQERGEKEKYYLNQARKKIETLSLEKSKKLLRPKRRFMDIFFSREKRLARHCRMFNLTLKYLTAGPLDSQPFEVTDVDYDNVSFNILFESKSPQARYSNACIELVAFNENGAEIARSEDYLASMNHPGQNVKRVYVPNSGKYAHKFLISITFAKNSSI